MTQTAHDPYAALRTLAFRWFLGSVVVLTLGTQVQLVAVAWRVYAATKDPLSLGFIWLAETLPCIAISLPTGHPADVPDWKRIASPAILALLAFGGMVDCVSVVIRATLLQVRTPERLLGRVSVVNGIFIGSANEIGAFESGVAARLLGTVPSVVVGGC